VQSVEIYADDESVLHFRAATRAGFISISLGWVGGWHQSPTEGSIFVLSGEARVEVGDGKIRRFFQDSV